MVFFMGMVFALGAATMVALDPESGQGSAGTESDPDTGPQKVGSRISRGYLEFDLSPTVAEGDEESSKSNLFSKSRQVERRCKASRV